MKAPCSNCPFRANVDFRLSEARAEQIAGDVILGDTWFACHQTVDYSDDEPSADNSSVCVGSLLSIAKERGDAMANLGVRLKVLSGQLELNDIDSSIPVWNAAEFVKNVGID